MNIAFDITQRASVSLEMATTNSLALGCTVINPHTSAWIHQLITDVNEVPYSGAYNMMLEELKKRTTSGLNMTKLADVATVLASKYTVHLRHPEDTPGITQAEKAADKVTIALSDDEYNVVETETLGGYVVPKNYPNFKVVIASSNAVDAFFFGLRGRTTSTRQEIDYNHCAKMKIPIVSLAGKALPDNVTRTELVAATKQLAMTQEGYLSSLLEMFPKQLEYSVATANFGVTAVPQLAKTIPAMYATIERYRQIRGTDMDSRHETVDGYYYGFPSRSHYRVSYVVQDILALGNSLRTNCLEITEVDGVVTIFVIASLVSQGWLIRVVNSSLYPVREKETKGVFRFFNFDTMYLRWAPIKENQPVQKSSLWVFNESLPDMIARSFVANRTDTCVPFTYAYLSPSMIQFEHNFKGCLLFPTAHAHNGHVIVVQTEVENDERLNLGQYIHRVCLANTWKTMYVYSKRPFWPVDPFGHKFSFRTRNKAPVDDRFVNKDDAYTFGDNVITFDRTFRVTQISSYNFKIIPEVVDLKKKTAFLGDLMKKKRQLVEDLKQNKTNDEKKKNILATLTTVDVQIKEGEADKKKATEVLRDLEKPPVAPPPISSMSFDVQSQDAFPESTPVPLPEDEFGSDDDTVPDPSYEDLI